MDMRLIQANYKPDSLSKIRQIFDEKIPAHEKTSLMYLRILSVKIQLGKIEEFRKIYTEQIIPALQAIKRCRYAYLTENIVQKNEILSVTI